MRTTSPNPSCMFGPDHFAVRLIDVSLDELDAAGVRGLILDLDNTLVAFRTSELEEACVAWIESARRRGFSMVMLSNNFSQRVNDIATRLDIPCVPNALKPLPFGFLRALRTLALPRAAVAVVGDQLFTDVLGGKLCGLRTILTEPIEAAEFPLTRVFRFLERLVLPQRRPL
ncbi:MAG: YqeG family HAD IIIA-type phosphatase [Vulcanimicrobiaceae bacterium]